MTLIQVEPNPVASTIDQFEETQKLSQLFTLARDEKRKYLQHWRRNYLLTNNRQFALDNQQPWSPNVTDSEIFPILSSRIAWMTDQHISAEIAPAALPGSPFAIHMETLSDQLSQILHSVSIVNGWDQQIILALWDAAQFGAGIFKCVWDSGLDEGVGNVALKRIDPWNFYPDPNAKSMDDMQYCIEVRKMTYEEIERRFPSSSRQLIAEAVAFGDVDDTESRPGPNGVGTYPMAMPGALPSSSGTAGTWGLPGQTDVSSQNILTKGVNVYECWIRENYEESRPPTDPTHPDPEPVVSDRWRVVVFTGSTVLLDELACNLWEFDRHPYERYVDEEMGEFWSSPLVSHLASPQTAVNRLLSSVQGNAELTGNPVFMDVANSGLARTQIVNRPGVRLTMDAQAAQGNTKPDWLKPPEVSNTVWSAIQFWLSRMENISGITGTQKGNMPSGRQAQQTTQAATEAASVRIRSSQRNLERTLSKCYQLLAHLIVQNYTVPRTVTIVGPEGQKAAIQIAARHFYSPSRNGPAPMRFSLIVRAGSSNPTSRQARIAESDALFQMEAIDQPALLEAHNYPNRQQIVDRMKKAAHQKMEFELAMHQKPHGPGTGHEH